MKKLHIISVLILFSFQIAFSQTKEIKGDTAFFGHKRNIELQKTLNLKDFEKSLDEFNFRFRNCRQVIEISKDSSKISGTIKNYIHHYKKTRKIKTEILSNKIDLSSKQAEKVYNIVLNSKILDLQSSESIKNWRSLADGSNYIIEHSDKKNYWLKKYWSPYDQDSIPEAKIVSDFEQYLSDTLKLEEIYSSFEKTLPKKGCYNSGGMITNCYVYHSLVLGYGGAMKLPFGFYSSYTPKFLSKSEINGSLALQYNFDNKGFHHLNLQMTKWNILYKYLKLSDYLDYIAYNYQNRVLNIENAKNKFENHQIKYGLGLPQNIGFGIGLDYIISNSDKIGGHFYASKSLPKLKINATLATSIFKNQVNYKAEILKSFYFNHEFPITILGLTYEDFMNYMDLYFSIRVLL
jgi:hypothetical protein